MTAPILVAGVGNVFFGDDGFGVEVARRLAAGPLPPGVEVRDFGIRGIHLAFELLEPRALVVLVDAMPRGGTPGSLYVVEPELADAPPAAADAHDMQLPAVLAAARAMGGALPRVLVVGCEPASCEEAELSAPVRAAVEPAVALVREVVRRERAPAAEAAGRGGEHEFEGEERGDRRRGAPVRRGADRDAEHAPLHQDGADVSRRAPGGGGP